jgi:hypothetical protein
MARARDRNDSGAKRAVGGTERHLLPAAAAALLNLPSPRLTSGGGAGRVEYGGDHAAAGTLDLLIERFLGRPGNRPGELEHHWTCEWPIMGAADDACALTIKRPAVGLFLPQGDPQMVALHRYIVVDVRGTGPIAGKLWCRDGFEQDLTRWIQLRTRLDHARFDTRKAR